MKIGEVLTLELLNPVVSIVVIETLSPCGKIALELLKNSRQNQVKI